MPSPLAVRIRLSQLAAGIVATIGIAIAPGSARVGVTSQTDGDPLGKPPTEAERVLRVGIDIQANEVITTKADDRAHVVFLDGTSLTVAPNAQLVVDKFVYDPDSKKGDLAISVTKGVFRLVGGKISKAAPMVVNTPSATIGVRGGIAVFGVEADETKAYFLFGNSLTVSANGRTQTATRPGSQIVTKLGGMPGAPVVVPPGSLAQVLASLEGRGGSNDDTADQKAKDSGFASSNSDQGLPRGERSPDQSGSVLQTLSNAELQQRRATTTAAGGAPVLGTAATPSFATTGPSSGPLSGPSFIPLAGPSSGPLSGPSSGPSSSPPPPPQLHGATPAIGVGNGGLVPAIPASPSRGRR